MFYVSSDLSEVPIIIFQKCWGYFWMSMKARHSKPVMDIHKLDPSRHWCHSGVFIVNFEHMSHFVLVLLLLIFNMKLSAEIE